MMMMMMMMMIIIIINHETKYIAAEADSRVKPPVAWVKQARH